MKSPPWRGPASRTLPFAAVQLQPRIPVHPTGQHHHQGQICIGLSVVHVQDQFLAGAHDNQANSPVSVLVALAIDNFHSLRAHCFVDFDTEPIRADVVINIQTACSFIWLPVIICAYWCLRPFLVPSAPLSALLIFIWRQIIEELNAALRYCIGDLWWKCVNPDTRLIAAWTEAPRLLFGIRDGVHMKRIRHNTQHEVPFVAFEGHEWRSNA